MSAKYLLTERSVRKQLKKLPLHVHDKVIKVLGLIQGNPLIGVKLHGRLANYSKYRIGDYRVVYEFDKKKSMVTIVKIEHRQGVYR